MRVINLALRRYGRFRRGWFCSFEPSAGFFEVSPSLGADRWLSFTSLQTSVDAFPLHQPAFKVYVITDASAIAYWHYNDICVVFWRFNHDRAHCDDLFNDIFVAGSALSFYVFLCTSLLAVRRVSWWIDRSFRMVSVRLRHSGRTMSW